LGIERVRGLFERFTDHRSDQRLATFEVASRLVVADAVLGFFLDEQEAPLPFEYRCDRDVGFPDHGKSLAEGRKMPFYCQRGGEIG
jgi:hypothetical protein